MVSRRRVIGTVLGGAAALVAAGCDGRSHGNEAKWVGSASGSSAAPSAGGFQLTVSPAAGTGVAPNEPVVVTASGGRLQSVTLSAAGDTIAGTVDAAALTWRSNEKLRYGQTYTVTVSAVDANGAPVNKTSTFSTVKPRTTARLTFQANALTVLKTGATYGVGQPVIVAFSAAVSDKTAAEKCMDIQTSPAVDGRFFWVSDKIVHWRPAQYWAKGTTINVKVNAYGVNLGKGVYGASDASTHFTIGRKLIAVCDNNTHRTRVYIDDRQVRDMACSNGMGGYTTIADGTRIHFWTQSGPHVVLQKQPTVSMSSASYGLTDKNNQYYYAPEDVRLCTRISYSGEFLHAAPWNHSLGKANRSHGCINLSVADAQWVYDNFLIGDIVDVRNSPKALPIWDGCGDWTVPYDRYGT